MRRRGDCVASACATAKPMPSLLTPVMRIVRSLIEDAKASATVEASVLPSNSGCESAVIVSFCRGCFTVNLY